MASLSPSHERERILFWNDDGGSRSVNYQFPFTFLFVQKLTASSSCRSNTFLQNKRERERERERERWVRRKSQKRWWWEEASRECHAHTRSFQLGGTLLCLRNRAHPSPEAPPALGSDSTLWLRHSSSRGSNNPSFSTTPPCPSQSIWYNPWHQKKKKKLYFASNFVTMFTLNNFRKLKDFKKSKFS
jgi:hypothetical protein